MEDPQFPLRLADIKETNDSAQARAWCQNGYLLLGLRENKFILDDNLSGNEFIYSLGLPEDE